MGEISVNFLICLLPDQSINRDADAYRRTQIDGGGDRGCLFQIPDINIDLSIDQSIDLYINRIIKQREGQIRRTADRGTHSQNRQKLHINRTDGCNNRQNKIPTIPDITIPNIPDINIDFH